MHAFAFFQPADLNEALQLLSEHGSRARILAGGTDLLIQMDTGRLRPEAVIFTARLPELRGIRLEADGWIRIGAAATLRQVENHPDIVRLHPALARSAREVGSVQIRNLATLAGNLCNASPSADTSPALLAYDAAVEIAGPGGARRSVPVGEFWTGPGSTVLREDEMVTAIRLPPPAQGRASFYRKLSVRKAMDLAMVGVSVALEPNGSEARRVRIALGAVAPVCLRATAAEAAVEAGGTAAIDDAARLAAAATSPIDDQRASAAYRREMVRELTARALRDLLSGPQGVAQ